MGRRRRITESIRDLLESWGLPLRTARTSEKGDVLHLLLPRDGREVLVGTLTVEGQDYVFRYTIEYREVQGARPLGAFPDLDGQEYRSNTLWPFFAARLPPLGRSDVQQVLEKAGVDARDTLRVLATLSPRAATNPYIFRLGGAGRAR
jgi:HipA-like protein